MKLSEQLSEAVSEPAETSRRGGMTEAKKKKALWAGVILDHPEFLITWFKRNVAPLHAKWHSHHMTAIFKPTPAQMARLDLGKKVTLHVVAYAADDKAQAVKVTGYRNADANRDAHITVSVEGGVSPFYSNELLSGGATTVSGPTLTGRVGFFDGKQDRFDLSGTIYEPVE